MHVGRVPALIILIVTLTTFGLMGLSLQSTLDGLFGWMLPGHIAWLPVLLCTFPVARVFTGLLSQVLPVLHETIPVNMNTLRLEVRRAADHALITRDRMRVDVLAEFYVRVQPTAESIADGFSRIVRFGGHSVHATVDDHARRRPL